MNVPVEIKVYEDNAGYIDYTDNDKANYDYELRVDKVTADWIKKVMDDFAAVQEYLRSIHPDYVER